MVQHQNKKSKKLFFAFLICMVFIFMLPMTGLAMTGSGTSADPYTIYDATDLQNIKNNLSANYKLANDINLSGVSFVPISTFRGTLDGVSHSIKNIKINTNESAGLFGFTAGATIKNLTLTVKEVTASSTYSGTLVAYAELTQIHNVHIRKVDDDSIVWAGESAGGLAGQISQSIITNCSSNIDVSASENAGGLIGISSASTINKSYATGAVTAEGYGAGGFVGDMFSSTISNSYAHGNVSGVDGGVGGFMAYANGDNDVTKCYSTGQVSGTGNIGGFSGGYYAVNTITNCYYTKSGTITDGQATPMTPEASLYQVTYLGFDFGSIWKIDEGTTTPYLKDLAFSSNAGLKNVKINQDLLLRKFTVTPVASDINALITVNGQSVESDSPSQQLTLNSGTNTVTIVVTAENGVTTKTYHVTVNGSVDPALSVS